MSFHQVLRQQVEKLRHENAILQANLQLHQADQIEEQKPIEWNLLQLMYPLYKQPLCIYLHLKTIWK